VVGAARSRREVRLLISDKLGIRLTHNIPSAEIYAQADLNGLLVERSLIAHAPAQIDGLETRSMLLAQTAQAGESVLLQHIPLRLQVLKGRTDKDTEGASGDRHGVQAGTHLRG